jgi:succinate-acetate transporter protein
MDDKQKKRLQTITMFIEIALLILAFQFVFERNPKIRSMGGAKAILSALCCTPCYIGYALAYPLKNIKA